MSTPLLEEHVIMLCWGTNLVAPEYHLTVLQGTCRASLEVTSQNHLARQSRLGIASQKGLSRLVRAHFKGFMCIWKSSLETISATELQVGPWQPPATICFFKRALRVASNMQCRRKYARNPNPTHTRQNSQQKSGKTWAEVAPKRRLTP